MIPMPAHLNKAWGTLWAAEHHPERPWWRYETWMSRMFPLVQFVRADGAITGPAELPVGYQASTGQDQAQRLLAADIEAVDFEHPLPAPPPMPGQVWAFPDGEAQITAVERAMLYSISERPEDAKLHLCPVWSTPLIRLNRQWHVTEAECQESQWPIRGAILVAGPSCYGFNTPWYPVEGK